MSKNKKIKIKQKTDYEKVILALHPAWEELKKHPHKDTEGQDGESIRSFSSNYSLKISELSEKLSNNKFEFQPLKRATVEKGREILIQRVEERIVSGAILQVVSPYLQGLNSNHDFSRRLINLPNGEIPEYHGIPLAVKIIQEHFNTGYVWVLEADIKGFFDNVPKKEIFKLISLYIKDKKVLEMIKRIIYFSPEISHKKEPKLYDKTKGLAQGSPLSPLLASIYLYEFDTFIIKNYPEVKLVRYVDDFIILCKDESTAKKMYDESIKKLKDMTLDMYKLGEIKNGLEKTRITCAKGYGSHSFDFLGLSFNHIDIDITKKKKEEIQKTIVEIINARGNFLQKTRTIESRLIGYIEHYKWAHYSRTVPSLIKIINFSQKELRSYFINTYIKITGQHPFKNFSKSKIDNLFKFIGIDFEYLLKKVTS